MNITQLCNTRRDALLPRWVDSFFASYPLDSAGFLRTGDDPFANPVGRITRDAAAVIYDAVAGNDVEVDIVQHSLTELMRLRAVQDMPPSRAVGVLFLLKALFRAEILPALDEGGKAGEGIFAEYLDLESRLDGLVLLALDMYRDNREQIFRIRVDELKRSQAQVIRWADSCGNNNSRVTE